MERKFLITTDTHKNYVIFEDDIFNGYYLEDVYILGNKDITNVISELKKRFKDIRNIDSTSFLEFQIDVFIDEILDAPFEIMSSKFYSKDYLNRIYNTYTYMYDLKKDLLSDSIRFPNLKYCEYISQGGTIIPEYSRIISKDEVTMLDYISKQNLSKAKNTLPTTDDIGVRYYSYRLKADDRVFLTKDRYNYLNPYSTKNHFKLILDEKLLTTEEHKIYKDFIEKYNNGEIDELTDDVVSDALF